MKKNYHLLAMLAAAALFVLPAQSKIIHLLPTPKSVVPAASQKAFQLQRAVRLEAELDSARVARFIVAQGGTLSNEASAPVVCVRKVDSIVGARLQNEAYSLYVGTDSVCIGATEELGVLRALQTMAQMAQGWDEAPALEACTIVDFPAFACRGFMHDVGRGFLSIAELKKEIDLLARFKINLFHWHLTDNQGWRIESRLYPQLTTSSYSRLDGKYYTQAEARDLVQYCFDRGITVMPEVDIPGHSESFTRAMGFGMQTVKGVAALKAILTELCDSVFPTCPYFHLGTDETSISYPNFVSTFVNLVRSLGKKAVSWHPGAPYTNTQIDMLTLWSRSGTMLKGVPNIDCRYLYANHMDSYADLAAIYRSNVYYAQTGTDELAGSEAAFWNDRALESDEDVVRQNGLYALLLAMGERAWMGGGKQYVEVGGTMMPPTSSDEFKAFADWERRFLFHKAHTLVAADVPYVRQTNVHWRITDAFPNGGDVTKTFPPETEGLKTSYLYNGTTYNTTRATGAGIYLRHTWGTLVPAFFASPQTNSTAYAYTYVYSPKDQTVGAQIEFQNYGRSENDLPPLQGKWDDRGSRIWVNDSEVMPPTWLNTQTERSSEVTLKNENMSARSPIAISLKKGWNKVLLKLPVTAFSTSRVRLEKWMFTFVLVTPDGTDAVEGLVYSPDKYADDATESVAELVSQAEASRNAKVSDAVGFYPSAAAADLDAVIAAISATLSDATVSADTRAQQQTTLQKALADFEANYTSYSVNMPKSSTSETTVCYTLCTPQRANRYLTSHGAAANLTGEASPAKGDLSLWKFLQRADGSFDMVCQGDATYLSPASAFNTVLKTAASVPSDGWTLKPAATLGQLIIVSGTVQVNQTSSGLGYKIYNWGSGTNTSDTGCQYAFAEAVPTAVATVLSKPANHISVVGSKIILSDNAPSRTLRFYDAAGRLARTVSATRNTTFSLPASSTGISVVEVVTSLGDRYTSKIALGVK